jgi:hypothetical protein
MQADSCGIIRKRQLHLKLARQPQIILIQKSDPRSLRLTDGMVSRPAKRR